MNLEEYKTVLRAIAEFKDYILLPPGNDYAGLINYCNKKIDELEKPPLKKYRCIKDMSEGTVIGDVWSEEDHWYFIYPADLPFHFEEIVHEPAPAPVTIKDIYECIDTESYFRNDSLDALFNRAKQEGNL